jgi:hypothetical protein
MENTFKNNDSKTSLEALHQAQTIAFAPVIFQIARAMRDMGVLEFLIKNDKKGATIEKISKAVDISIYATKVLLESSLSADIVSLKDGKYRSTKTGYFLAKDEMTKVNMNYNHYVNYKGLFDLQDSLKSAKPVGLQNFSESETIYPILSKLPNKAKKAWFEFDHFYSSDAFGEVVKIVSAYKPKHIVDIGGNTGKFAIKLAQNTQQTHITIADLPSQIDIAKANIGNHQLSSRVSFVGVDMLDDSSTLPQGACIYFMSQFLDCFDEKTIVKILKKIQQSMNKTSKIFILEPLWDKQRFVTSSYCIINTSPFFTAMANGYSKMFSYQELAPLIKQSGLAIEKSIHNIAISQSIIVCRLS